MEAKGNENNFDQFVFPYQFDWIQSRLIVTVNCNLSRYTTIIIINKLIYEIMQYILYKIASKAFLLNWL